MNEDLFAGLPDILFAVKDAAEVEREIVRAYEQASGRSLAPGDPVRLFLLTIASVIVQQRALIDFTGKQNLLAYSSEGYLDHLGALLGVYRLPATSALTTLRFTLSAAQPGATIIPIGTRATPGGGDLYFSTAAPVSIAPGETVAEVEASCMTVGEIGNGYLPGQISSIVDPLPWVQTVENITTTSGGADTENDDSLRERIQIAPEKFSVGGPTGAYEYWARTAHQSISDVSVVSPIPGEVHIYPLLSGGELPSEEILNAVDAICSAEDIRPTSDLVSVLSPVQEEYSIDLGYWIDRKRASMGDGIVLAVEAAVQAFVAWQCEVLGRDINPSKLIAAIVGAGAKRVAVTTPVFTELTPAQVAKCTGITVTFEGFEDG